MAQNTIATEHADIEVEETPEKLRNKNKKG